MSNIKQYKGIKDNKSEFSKRYKEEHEKLIEEMRNRKPKTTEELNLEMEEQLKNILTKNQWDKQIKRKKISKFLFRRK